MPFTEIEKTFTFEAAHRLPHVPEGHKCARLHGHSFRVTIRVGGEVDARMGWICDFADLSAAWQPLFALLDHRYLNEVEGLANPTSELIAAWIAARLAVPPSAKLRSITVHETCTSGCTLYLDA